MRKKSGVALVLLCVLFLSGCGSLSKGVEGGRPADFALVFFVDEPDGRNVLYLLEPSRTLRVAVGKDVTASLFPPATATLPPDKMDRLWTIIEEGDLLDESDVSVSSDMTYHLSITQHGRTHHLKTTPDVSPAATRLLMFLNQLTMVGSTSFAPKRPPSE